MSQYVDGNHKSYPASAAIAINSRVILEAAGTVVTAGLAEKEIGTAVRAAFAAGDIVTVRLRTAAGTHTMRAKEAIAAGATIYTEAAGEVQDTDQATAFQIGTALTAATAENDELEVLYNAHGDTAAS